MKKNDKDGVIKTLIKFITSFVYRCVAYLCCWCLPKRDDDGNNDSDDYSSEKKPSKTNNHNTNGSNDENEWKEEKNKSKKGIKSVLMYDDELAQSNQDGGCFDYDLSKNKQAHDRNYDLDNLEKNVNLEETLSNINNSNDEEEFTSKRVTYKLSFENEQSNNINNNNKIKKKNLLKTSLIDEIEEIEYINSTASTKSEAQIDDRNMDQLKQKTADLKAKLQSMKKPKEHKDHDGTGALKKLTDKLHIKKKKTGDRSAMMDIKLKEMVNSLAEKSRLKPKSKCHISGGPSFGRRPSTRISKFGDSCSTSGVNNSNINSGCKSKSVTNMRSDRNESYIDEIESEYKDISLVENI